MPFYAVHKGFNPGIYPTWDLARKQIEGYPNAIHKKFTLEKDAIIYVALGHVPLQQVPIQQVPIQQVPIQQVPIQQVPLQQVPLETYRPLLSQPLQVPIDTDEELNLLIKEYDEVTKIDSDQRNIYIYTDGSFKGGRCGYGVFYGNLDKYVDLDVRYKGQEVEGKKTNNIGELTAIFEAVKTISTIKDKYNIIIYSDSEYAIGVSTGKKMAHKNLGIINDIKDTLAICVCKVSFRHIFSHTGKKGRHYIGNNIADILASMNH